mmetsp:Transcript_15632/g.33242  ORF Transcript_15632/g.33242 Transcript_15632/m.33242 type:complete len:196 (-) Transcript_15632:62-649(-)
MAVGENQNPAHIFWQQRVDKERKAANKNLRQQQRKLGARPHQELHHTRSMPALMPIAEKTAIGSGGTPILPKIAGASERDGVWQTGPVCEDCSGVALADDSCTARTATARSMSQRGASMSRGDLKSQGSMRSSMHSSLTGLTTASLRREVAEAVASEVAKVVQPLKEKLQSEQSNRQRLEEMLRHVSKAEELTAH